MSSKDEIAILLEWSREYFLVYPEFFSDSDREGYERRIGDVEARYTEFEHELSKLVAHDFATLKKHKGVRDQISIEACDVYSDIQWVVNSKRESLGSQNK